MILPVNKKLWSAEWRELYEERAGILEFEGHLRRDKAEIEAENGVRRIAERDICP
jgi:hypothetical protein